jgi:trigger factor
MQVTETLSEGLKRELTVRVPAADITGQVQTRLEEIGRTAKLPGFRPGRTPMSVLRKRFGPSVLGEVLQETVSERTQKAMDDRGLRPALQPRVDIKQFAEGADLEYSVAMEVMPDIKAMDFSGLEIERLEVDVPQAKIDEVVGRMAEQARTSEPAPADHTAAKGEVVVIDFEGKVNGAPLAGGSAKDYHLELGTGGFIPGFEDQLVGAKAGEQKTVSVTFPADYGMADVAGKPAEFAVTVKEVRQFQPVIVDDALAARIGVGTLGEMRERISERLATDYKAMARGRLKRALFDKLESAHDFPLPEGLVEQEFQTIWSQVEEHLKGPRRDEELAGKSEDELKADYRKVAARRVRLGLLLAEVGRQNGLQVTQEDMNRAIRAEAARFPGQERQVLEFYQQRPEAMARLQAPIIEEKVVDFIVELARVTTRKVTPEELIQDDEAATPAAEAQTS